VADTNIRLLARKIEALDADAQHAVEVAVDSLLEDAALALPRAGDERIATLERRVGALADEKGSGEVVFLDEHDCDLPALTIAIERLIDAGHRALAVLVPANATRDTRWPTSRHPT
jgi:hypothetical protein